MTLGCYASATGTWGDPGADVVTLTASVGTVTKNADGTWSWSLATANGSSQTQTVVITATDSSGVSSSASFQLTVSNLAPAVSVQPSANGSTQVDVNEGDTATASGFWSDPGNDVAALSDREMQIFRLLGSGLGTRAVAEELRVSVKTIETHRAHIKEKLGFHDSKEMVRFSITGKGNI